MKYLELINKFWEVSNVESIGANATAIYFYLIEQLHQSSNESVSISDAEIAKTLKLSRPTINQAKQNLRNLGLLHFQVRKGKASIYRLNSNYTKQPAEITSEKVEHSPKKPTMLDSLKKTTNPKTKLKKLLDNPKEEKANNNPEPLNQIPSIEEFLAFAKTIEIYKPELDFQIKTKYESWKNNGWRNGYDRPIRNWKTSLKSTLPFITGTKKSTITPPLIKRPKQTYNE